MADVLSTIVDLGERSYPVFVGRGARHEIVRNVPASAQRIAVVTQSTVPAQLIPEFGGAHVEVFTIGDGEDNKSLSTIENLCREFSRMGLTRNDVVVGVGGGLVTDVAGFAASVYHRGLPVVHVATTLLAMIDAAIGGKTGVNIPEGKNLIGAYWQPRAVACDMDALLTLPPDEINCGYGEMAKYHFIGREDLSSLPMRDRILRCVQIKADIVAVDEREGGQRALLNYGHTLGHAVETVSNYSIPHGVSVAIGLLFAAHLAEVRGMITPARVDEHYAVVHDLYQLTTRLPSGMSADAAIDVMARDKKALDSLTFVLDSTDGLKVVPGVTVDEVRRAYGDFAARLA